MFIKNLAGQFIGVQMVARADGTDLTTGTVTVYATKDNGTQASLGTATHKGNGYWSYALAQADSNADHVAYTFIHTSGVSTTINVYPTVLADIVIAGIKADLAGITGEARRSILNALRKLLNRWVIGGSTLTVYKEDDTTSAYTEALTTAAGADSLTASDPS